MPHCKLYFRRGNTNDACHFKFSDTKLVGSYEARFEKVKSCKHKHYSSCPWSSVRIYNTPWESIIRQYWYWGITTTWHSWYQRVDLSSLCRLLALAWPNVFIYNTWYLSTKVCSMSKSSIACTYVKLSFARASLNYVKANWYVYINLITFQSPISPRMHVCIGTNIVSFIE